MGQLPEIVEVRPPFDCAEKAGARASSALRENSSLTCPRASLTGLWSERGDQVDAEDDQEGSQDHPAAERLDASQEGEREQEDEDRRGPVERGHDAHRAQTE